MTRRQRAVLAVAGALVVAAGVGAGVTAKGGHARLGVEGAGSDRDASTSSTYALVPVTGGTALPTTAAPPPPKPPRPPEATTAAPPTTAAAPHAEGLSTAGAVLAAPAGATPRAVDKSKGCRSANDAGWSIVDCGALKTQGMVLLWVVETKGPGLRALVLREQGAGQWVPALAAADDAGSAFGRIGVHGDDVSGDGQPDLLFGFHRKDTGALALDVVEAPGAVTLHLDMAGGSARTAPGQVETWSADPESTTATHQVVRRGAAGWQVTATDSVARRDVPTSIV